MYTKRKKKTPLLTKKPPPPKKKKSNKNPLEILVKILVTNLLFKKDFNLLTKFRSKEILKQGRRKFLKTSTLVEYNIIFLCRLLKHYTEKF